MGKRRVTNEKAAMIRMEANTTFGSNEKMGPNNKIANTLFHLHLGHIILGVGETYTIADTNTE